MAKSFDSADEIKLTIKKYVEAYKWAFPQDYTATIEQVRKNRSNTTKATGDFTKFKGTDLVERPIHEISELLFTILHRQLSEEELNWFGSKLGARWFAKTYPEFSRVDRV